LGTIFLEKKNYKETKKFTMKDFFATLYLIAVYSGLIFIDLRARGRSKEWVFFHGTLLKPFCPPRNQINTVEQADSTHCTQDDKEGSDK
jgi:hypothetical protein